VLGSTPMVLILFAVGPLFVILVIGVAGWRIACWMVRGVLGIPKHPPFIEPRAPDLPYYLDNRVTPPD
jgi:hypothetical protein